MALEDVGVMHIFLSGESELVRVCDEGPLTLCELQRGHPLLLTLQSWLSPAEPVAL